MLRRLVINKQGLPKFCSAIKKGMSSSKPNASCSSAPKPQASAAANADEWRHKLTPKQYSICRLGGTEPPFTGKYWDSHLEGAYLCACCNTPLFSSKSKFDSGTGWPSFFTAIDKDAIDEVRDNDHGMERMEVRCAKCHAHLGHVFDDGPAPTGLRYCINSASLDFCSTPQS